PALCSYVMRQDARCVCVSAPSAAEVHAHPDRPGLVGEHVHVVIAAPDGAELISRLSAEAVPLVTARNGVPRRVLEQRMVGGRVVGAVGAADAERDSTLDLVRQALELGSGGVVDA